LGSLKAATHVIDEIRHPFAVVLSQDCDLEQDFFARVDLQSGELRVDKLIPTVLLLEAMNVNNLRATTPKGRERWKRISQNNDERYQVLQAVRPEEDAEHKGLPA